MTWEEKFNYDVWYVDNQSFRLDLKIIVKTISQVFNRSGVAKDGHATVDEFMGTKQG
jgi:lipopolysaccharide/colanic/teichoic acid biosynthesis glycosyltransferase